jgi:tyrosyl-tRNA synthetase
VNSKSEAKRAIQGNAIAINKEKTTDVDAQLGRDNLLHDRYILIENGKKNRYLLTLS